MRATPLIALALSLWATVAGGQDRERSITIAGEGRVSAPPDTAWIDIGVVAESGDAASTLAEISQATRRLIDRLEDEGVRAENVQTGQLQLGPVYDRDRDGIVGFRGESVLAVRVDDLDRLGSVVAAGVEDGANRFDGLRLGLADPGTASDAALRAAVEDALAKAELVASAAETGLGAVLRIVEDEGRQSDPSPMLRMSIASDAEMPIASGMVETVREVTMTIAIE